jgi:hypothetical protein
VNDLQLFLLAVIDLTDKMCSSLLFFLFLQQELMKASPSLNNQAMGGEHFMRTVKEIAQARLEETGVGFSTLTKYRTISELLDGKKVTVERTEKQKRRISNNGAMLLREAGVVDDEDTRRSNRK